MQGVNRGWIYCRDHEDECVDFVTPKGPDVTLKAIQRFQMREVMHGPTAPPDWSSLRVYSLRRHLIGRASEYIPYGAT